MSHYIVCLMNKGGGGGGGGGGSFCRGQIIHFNLARRCAENVKFYYMFIPYIEQFLK